MPRPRLHPSLTVVMIVAVLAAACSSSGDDDGGSEPSPAPDAPAPGPVSVSNRDGPLGVRLAEGAPLAQTADPTPIVDGDPLGDDVVQAVLARLGPWSVPVDDPQPFVRPEESLPPPRPGATVDRPFPPPDDDDPPAVATGPLQVVRVQPEGDVALAPVVSITFDQPMVALGTVDQTDAAPVPATISPEPPGHWEWIGTRTLRFEHDGAVDRLPMATTYTVEVPAGTTSATGGELAEAVRFGFATPPVTLESLTPRSDSLPLEPVWVATFDQRVDADEVIDTVTVTADGREAAVRPATEAEIDADDDLARVVEQAGDARWVAFTPAEPLPADAAVEVAVGPGTPSAEGPRTTTDAQSRSMRTFAPLRVRGHSCERGDCRPGSGLWIEMNNPLDEQAFDPDWVRVDPEPAGLRVQGRFDGIAIGGEIVGDTTYTVTLDADLVDIHGQRLGEATDVEMTVGPAPPALAPFEGELITLDPFASDPVLTVDTINHDAVRVRAFPVEPDQWPDYLDYWEDWSYGELDTDLPSPPWTAALDTEVAIDSRPHQLTRTDIDLADLLVDGHGHLIVIVEPVGDLASLDVNDERFWSNRPTLAWVQGTDLAVDAFDDGRDLVVWTTALASGEVRGAVQVSLPGAATVATGDDGLARLSMPTGGSDRHRQFITAAAGDDRAILPGGWQQRTDQDVTAWHLFDDRGIYRPGETAHFKGWVRGLRRTGAGDLALIEPEATARYRVQDAQGNELATGDLDLDALGGFSFAVDIPETANLGPAEVRLQLVDSAFRQWHHDSIDIQDFRRPQFEVVARAESPAPYFVDRPATVAVDASYFAGGPLPDAPVEWVVTTDTTRYSPPNWSDFTFGTWQPWWIEDSGHGGFAAGDASFEVGFDPGFDEPVAVETFSARTGADGSHFLEIGFTGDGDDQPTTVRAQATVTDVARQAWASAVDLLVHPADVYVGLRSARSFVRRGESLPVELIATDLDGTPVADRPVEVTASRLEWQYRAGEWREEAVDPQTCAVTSGTEPVDCTFDTDVGGTYQVVAVVTDAAGRANRSELTRWVSGGTGRPDDRIRQETATLVPSAEEYVPGDTAEILVQSPFGPATGLVTVSRHGFESTETFSADDGTAVVEIPITDDLVPAVRVQVDLVGRTPRTGLDGRPVEALPDRPAFATGSLRLAVPPVRRALTVTPEPAVTELEPGADTAVTVGVADADGDPVAGADVAVVVVDEAVLALTGYELADPNDSFFAGGLDEWINGRYLRSTIELSRAEALERGRADDDGTDATSSDEGGEDLAAAPASTVPAGDGSAFEMADEQTDGADPIELRENFDALALFAPDETTGTDGSVTVDVTLPDNLTRYRVMAVAVGDVDSFGSGEATITARRPLQVRPSAPRFANFGDRFELPVVVQNLSGADVAVDVAIETSNLDLTDGAGRRVTVPAGDRVEVRFPVETSEAGAARYRVAAVADDLTDAAVGVFPVYTPATSEAFATHGVIDEGAIAQPLTAPAGVVPQFGGLEIDTSSTALSALTDAVLYLHEYRYPSSDGLAAQIASVAALRDVLEAFAAEGLPPPDQLAATVDDRIAALVALQNGDGGFPHWRRGERSIPFNSIASTHALVVAAEAGYGVPPDARSRALRHLADIENHFPAGYSQRVKDTLTAYALHVRHRAGDSDPAGAQTLFARAGESLQLDAQAWLWPVLDDPSTRAELARRLANAATETAGAATFATDYGDETHLLLHSDRRTDGIVLGALVSEDPDSDLIPKVVAGLLGGQTQGRWGNASENVFILLALHDYFDAFEQVDPDFVARVWLGDDYAAEHTFAGRSTDHDHTLVPMTVVTDGGDRDLIVAKDGPGRLYYRLGLRYAPADLTLEPRDRGFVVARTYEAVDHPGDVRRAADGTWQIRAGAEVQVTLTMVADSRRTHVALIDPLPAGFEASNPALAVTPDPPRVSDDASRTDTFSAYTVPWWHWYDHQNLRDDRAEAFATLLPAGTYEYTYTARATTPGSFVVPPTRAEEIYTPETFGRAGTDRVEIS